MKVSSGLAILGTFSVVASAAQPHARGQAHAHAHRHIAKQAANPVERRADVTTYTAAAVETVYENTDGQILSEADVEEGLKDGYYVLVSDSSSSSSSTKSAGEFYQKSSTKSTSSSSSTSPPTSTSTSVPVPVAAAAAKNTSPAAAAAAVSSGSGVNSDFPSGKIPCSQFPSSYGAVAAPWLGLNGWTGVQQTPNYAPGAGSISYIVTGVPGTGCVPNSFCSYACPAGYQKVHWPTAQGATGQSIGGLYCNAGGMLELTNSAYQTLCGQGTGEVMVQNKLSENVAICRTDYPGTESETIALDTQAGQTYELTCPNANTYYFWGGKPTSAQYYVNPRGVPKETACKWGDGSSQTGNWAPINLGVGKGTSGETFISMFYNKPTNPNPSLDFSITITGGISGSCSYSGGTFWSNGVASASGCTVSVQGVATYVFA